MELACPSAGSSRTTIAAGRDLLSRAVWVLAVALGAAATLLRTHRVLPSATATAEPFLTLAAVVAGGMVADRMGMFQVLARVLIPGRAGPRLSAAAVLAFTGLVSGLANLDIAVVVSMPVALRIAQRAHLPAGRLAVAAALTANATSFLLPTSNLTNLLVLSRCPLPASTYVQDSWIAWLLVTALTIGVLTVVAGRPVAIATSEPRETPVSRMPVVLDLIPMFVAASAIRALLGTGLVLGRGFFPTVAIGSLLAAGVNNLPAAAAVQPVGAAGRWAVLLAMALGPNLLLTGSVASLICRRITHDGQARFGATAFTVLGTALLPAQLLVALAGLTLTGALG